jgi:predicted nucleic acid-binding protein
VPIVLDASALIAWLVDDEEVPQADAAVVRAKEEGAIAPLIWWYEVRNSLIVNERRGRLSKGRFAEAVAAIAQLRVDIDPAMPEDVVAIARRRAITAYDAAYVELAKRRRLPLATLDGRLAAAAAAERVPLVIE